jgi:ubiquitin-protein ligase
MYMKRVEADVKELQTEFYRTCGIYYTPDESSLCIGYACIFGPIGTPYEDCPMLYKIECPTSYPFDPPTVTFCTQDGITRFHPNMYKDGKVCLSILHTWQGPRWASTLRISSLLVTIQSLLDNDPLCHEPGYDTGHTDMIQEYSSYIEVACIRYTLDRIGSHLCKKQQPTGFPSWAFELQLASIFHRLEQRLQQRVQAGEHHFTNLPYQMYGTTGYADLLIRLVKLKELWNSTIE